jgi:hypothetical protein
MATAIAREDFERAALLRDQIKTLSSGTEFKRQVPGRMGLGTDQQAHRPPPGWVPPAKPDPMTSGHRKGGRRSKP